MNVWRYEEDKNRVSIGNALLDKHLPILIELSKGTAICLEAWLELSRDEVVSLRNHLNRLLGETK